MYHKSKENTAAFAAKAKAKNEWGRRSRTTDKKRAMFIRQDMQACDRKKGRPRIAIDLDWIDEQISKPCIYCHQQLDKVNMTLDRIDNSRGHTQDNLVPACRVCNYFRRDMPYDAWVILAENMPKIIKLDLLRGWSAGGGLRGRRKLDSENTINQPQAVLGRSN